MNFNFPQKKRVGIDKLLPHATPECIELIYKLCEYDPDERMTARQALRHAYFKDLRSVCIRLLSIIFLQICGIYIIMYSLTVKIFEIMFY